MEGLGILVPLGHYLSGCFRKLQRRAPAGELGRDELTPASSVSPPCITPHVCKRKNRGMFVTPAA